MASSKTPSNHFQTILAKAIRENGLPNRTKKSQEWFQNQAKAIEFLNKKEFLRDQFGREKVTPGTIQIGDMITYNYHAKHRDTLPVWDRYPLIFPFNVQADRFYGLNFHYLPHGPRAQLLDALRTIATDNRYTPNTKILLTWKLLKTVATADLYEPTVHCYIKRNVKSKVKKIMPMEWDYAIFLPLAKFTGKDADAVAQHQSFQ